MKYRKILIELDGAIQAADDCRARHRRTLRAFLAQFQAEEARLSEKLRMATDENSRKKWQEKLGLVREAYEILEA